MPWRLKLWLIKRARKHEGHEDHEENILKCSCHAHPKNYFVFFVTFVFKAFPAGRARRGRSPVPASRP